MSENEIRCMKRVFTLIEIMVALGALMLMMSFLFEFVIGAQRIWRASEHKSGSFDDAETVLSFVGEDIRNMRYSNQIGYTRPFLVIPSPDKICYKETHELKNHKAELFMWMFYAQFKDSRDTNSVGVYPVVYVYVGNTDNASDNAVKKIARTLFRVPLVENAGDSTKNWEEDEKVKYWNILQNPCHVSFTSPLSCDEIEPDPVENDKFTADYKKIAKALCSINLTDDDILIQNATKFDLEILPPAGVGKNWADKPTVQGNQKDFYKRIWYEQENGTKVLNVFAVCYQPRGVQIKVSISPRDAISDDEWDEKGASALDKNERSFTKTISLDTN